MRFLGGRHYGSHLYSPPPHSTLDLTDIISRWTKESWKRTLSYTTGNSFNEGGDVRDGVRDGVEKVPPNQLPSPISGMNPLLFFFLWAGLIARTRHPPS